MINFSYTAIFSEGEFSHDCNCQQKKILLYFKLLIVALDCIVIDTTTYHYRLQDIVEKSGVEWDFIPIA
jgi:hypothetical protein